MHNKIDFDNVNDNRLFDKMVVSSFPEILPLKDLFEKNEWHNETTYDHVRNVFINMNKFFTDNFDINLDKDILYYAAIYHDIGKLETIRISPDEATSFPNHESISAEKLPEQKIISVLGEERFNLLKTLIAKHADIHKILDNKKEYITLLGEYKRDFRNLFLENIILTLCDIKNSHLVETDEQEYNFRAGVLEEFINKEIS